MTNADGIAVLQNLRFDSRPGQYNIIASVADVGSVSFLATALGGQLTATYDLLRPFLLNVTGGHIQLFDDGSYRIGYDAGGPTGWSARLPFIRSSPGRIEFYLDPSTGSAFYASINYLFAIGTLSDDTLTVSHKDVVDFDDEVYVLVH